MTSLLEMREKLKLIYSKNEVFIIPVVKFLLAFVALTMVNGQLGYMNKIDNIAVVLIVSLLCSFLPNGCIILFAALFSLLHMYALSLEVAIVGFCVFLVMFLLFFRFSPKDSIVVVLTPILFVLKIPYVIPIVMGLLGTPAAAVSIGCGVVVYYFLDNVAVNATTISTMGAEEATAKLRMVIDGLMNNRTMVVMVVAFAVTVIVVYLIRRMAIDYSWTIAMIAGVIINLVILLVGDLMYDTNMSLLGAVLGSVAAIVIAKILEFFRFCVDYSRTEKVQFEDDEYYYYVKAVPKMTVTAPTKTVKKINTQRRTASSTTRSNTSSEREGRDRDDMESRGYQGRSTQRTSSSQERSGGQKSSSQMRGAGIGNTSGVARSAGLGNTSGAARSAGIGSSSGTTRNAGLGNTPGTSRSAGPGNASGTGGSAGLRNTSGTPRSAGQGINPIPGRGTGQSPSNTAGYRQDHTDYAGRTVQGTRRENPPRGYDRFH